jgi:hypothetical protein
MDLVKLNEFVARAIDINAIAPGTGVSAGGYIGAMSPRQEAVNDFKEVVINFDSEAHREFPDKEKLDSLYGRVEGGLLGLNALAIIDDHKLKSILADLSELNK